MSAVFEALDNWKSCMQFIVQISGVASSYLIKNIYRKENKKEKRQTQWTEYQNNNSSFSSITWWICQQERKREMWINAV